MAHVTLLKLGPLPIVAGDGATTERGAARTRREHILGLAFPDRVVAAQFSAGLNVAPRNHRHLIRHADIRIAGMVNVVVQTIGGTSQQQAIVDKGIGDVARDLSRVQLSLGIGRATPDDHPFADANKLAGNQPLTMRRRWAKANSRIDPGLRQKRRLSHQN